MASIDDILSEEFLTPQDAASKLTVGADANPVSAAEAVKQARRNNIPPSLVGTAPDPDIARQNQLQDDAERIRNSRILNDWLANQPLPVVASVRDDLPRLSAIGQAVQFAKNTGSALYSGVPAFSEGVYGLIEAGGGMLPDIVGDPIEQFGSYYRQRMAASKEYLTPKSDSAIGQGYYSGLQSVTQMLATLPMAVMSGNPALVALPMAGVTAGQAYGQAREKGLGVGQSTLFGIEQGAVEYITEKFPVGQLVKDLEKSTGFGKLLLGQLAREIPGEQAATFLQDFNEWVNLNPEKSLGDFMRERPDAAISTAVATLVGSGVVSSAAYSANRLVQRVANDDARIQQAQEAGKLLNDLSALAQASVVRERDVETFEGFLQTATDGTPLEAVYIDAKTLQDSGLAEKLAQQSPTVAEQLPQAQAGTMIRIPTEEVMGRFHQDMVPLLPELRLDPNGMNQREAEDFMANRGDQLQAEVEQVLSNAQADAEVMQARERVKTAFADEIMATGRVTKDIAESYATLASTFYHVMGQRLGVNAEELYNQHRLGVQGQGAGEFDQQAGAATVSLGGREVPVQIDGHDQRAGFTLVPVNTAAFDAGFQRDDGYVGPKGEGGIGNRYDRFGEFQKDASFITAPTVSVSEDGKVVFGNGRHRYAYMRDNGVPSIPVAMDAESLANAIAHGYVNQDAADQLYQRAPKEKKLIGEGEDAEKRVLRREPGDFNPEEQRAFDDYMATRPDADRIMANLAQHKGTPWAKQAVEGIFVRQAMRILMTGQEPNFQSSIDSSQVKTMRAALLSRGEEGLWNLLEAGGGIMGAAAKPVNNVNSSFINCDPSPDCAKYCYATKGNYIYSNVIAKSELVTLAVELDPVRAARRTAAEYKATAEFLAGKALRLFDKGDGDAAWLPFIAELNRQGIRTQIFSKVPEFLRQVPDMNLRLLSIDESNMGMADANPDLPVAFVYTGKHQIDVLAKLASRGQIQVVLPIKQGQKLLDGSDIDIIRKEVPDAKPYLCPIDAGFKKLGKSSDKGAWNCTKCDVNGGVGCFHGKPTKMVMESLEAKPNPQARAARILELREQINAITGNAGADVAAAGRVPPGRVEGLLREVDTLLGELLRDYDPGSEGPAAAGAGRGTGPQGGGPGGAVSSLRGIPIRTEPAAPGNRGRDGGGGEFQQTVGEARGSFSPSELVIRLTKASDLSTYLHESGHFFLHMLTEFAARPDAPADIVADADTALKWMGVESTPELSRVGAWRAMTVDEQRAAHEKFARGFEVYLSEGKAPSMELQGLFARFRSWLLNVYRYLKQGMAKGLDVQLNDEVRAVFDRMLATEDEIQNAEAARSMGMMFATEQEAANFGVDWRGYQAQAQAATDEAVAAMDAKTVKNMRWLDNARSRLLSKMQSEARTVRREVRTGVRTEVMRQPVYQAYQFLTGKLTDEDRGAMERQAPMKSKAGPLDPRIDSLFVAIAKLGGISRESLQSQWGLDPATKIPPPYFGGHVIRAEGGDSIDGMLQKLEAEGYLPLDEYGRAWTNEFEDRFYAELRGDKQYSTGFDPTLLLEDEGLSAPVEAMGAGRLREADLMALARDNDIPSEVIDTLVKRRMVAKERGLNPEVVAFQFGFGSADEMVRALAEAAPPREAIETATDQRMLERYSDLATPEGRERAVDAALAGEARTRMVETELSALEAANNTRTVTQDGKGKTRRVNTLPAAARQFARQVIDRLRVRDVRPAQFSGSASRAARAASEAARAGKVPEAALEKRNELVNMYATRYANDALDGVRSGLTYLKKFDKDGTRKNIDPDYLDQIDAILERYDLRQATQKGLDRRKALADWIAEQEAAGIEPDLPDHIRQERQRVPYQELTVEEFNGLVDSVRQIEHFGRLKKKLLLAKDKREFAALVQEIRASIEANSRGRRADNATRTDLGGRLAQAFRGFTAAHRKMASLVYQLDGFKDGGPLWEVLVRTANEQGNWEATKQAELTARLATLLKGVKRDSVFSRGRYFDKLGMSLTHEQRLVVALNWGNEGNRQRLMDGRNWSAEGVQDVLDTLTQADWDFVQGAWDTFESLRPSIAEKERRVMGKEPEWVQPSPVVTKFGTLKGGYYPAVYDPRENLKAAENESAEAVKRQLQGARSAATTRRNFVKARATEVKGRPLLLTMDGMFRGLTDVVHDLAYHEWLIDANRLLRALDPEIRDTYGAEVVNQLRAAKDAIAAGEASAPHALDAPVRHIRAGAMVAGLGFNLVNAMLQPLGITQSVVRVGGRWIAQGAGRLAANPRALARDVMEKSEFMRNRARTQNRELNDVRNRLRGKSETRQFVDAALFWPMTTMQLAVDLPTWWGAYQKALHDGADEDTAVQRADQAVIDSQGGGQIKDLAAIQRGPEIAKLFTTFYGYFSTAYNLGVERYRATNKSNPLELMKLAGDFLLLYSVPAVLGFAIKEAMVGGGDDEDEIAKKLAREQLSYLFGLMVGVREMTGAAQMALGLQAYGAGYGGPAGLRFLQELQKLAQQVNQGEWDEAARRSTVNVGGILLHLPSAQINRTLDGIQAMQEGRTQNPAALIGGAK